MRDDADPIEAKIPEGAPWVIAVSKPTPDLAKRGYIIARRTPKGLEAILQTDPLPMQDASRTAAMICAAPTCVHAISAALGVIQKATTHLRDLGYVIRAEELRQAAVGLELAAAMAKGRPL